MLAKAPPPTASKAKVETPTKDELRDIAMLALVSVAANAKAPAAARAAAARTLLESLGDIGRLQEVAKRSEKPLNEMTAAEVDSEIARLRPSS